MIKGLPGQNQGTKIEGTTTKTLESVSQDYNMKNHDMILGQMVATYIDPKDYKFPIYNPQKPVRTSTAGYTKICDVKVNNHGDVLYKIVPTGTM